MPAATPGLLAPRELSCLDHVDTDGHDREHAANPRAKAIEQDTLQPITFQ